MRSIKLIGDLSQTCAGLPRRENGIWILIFPDRERTNNLSKVLKYDFTIREGNLPPVWGNLVLN